MRSRCDFPMPWGSPAWPGTELETGCIAKLGPVITVSSQNLGARGQGKSMERWSLCGRVEIPSRKNAEAGSSNSIC